jgi:hypothetical protein
MSAVELGTKSDCAGEGQQQITLPYRVGGWTQDRRPCSEKNIVVIACNL